jgi:hypothetical protein
VQVEEQCGSKQSGLLEFQSRFNMIVNVARNIPQARALAVEPPKRTLRLSFSRLIT